MNRSSPPTTSPPSRARFPRERLLRLVDLEQWHFWFIGRRRLVLRLLEKWRPTPNPRVLDIGCGSGFMVRALSARGYRAFGMDGRPEGLLATRALLPSSLLVLANAEHLPALDEAVDVVFLLDVLEHVDDMRVLAEAHRVMRPGGSLVITVPALPWLWSYRDEAAGHRRRYTERRLRTLLFEAGFSVRTMRYYQFFTLPLLVLMRVLGRRSPAFRDAEENLHPVLNRILTMITHCDVILGQWLRWPRGASVVAVCVKE